MIVHEDIEILFLQFKGNFTGNFLAGRRSHDSCETGRGTINELNPAFTEDDVVGSAEPDVFRQWIFRFGIERGFIQVTDSLVHLFGKKGCHACIEGGCQIGQPEMFVDERRQKFAALHKDIFHVTERLYLCAQHTVNDGQKIGSVGEMNLLFGAIFFQCRGIRFLCHIDDFMGASDGG